MFDLAMPELLRSAKLAVEKGQAQGRDQTYVKQLSDYIVPALVEALHKVGFDFSPLVFCLCITCHGGSNFIISSNLFNGLIFILGFGF